ncbi:MAG: hypothetical protein ACJ75J_06530, partial [Cytophagaceae bacterium]
MQGNILVLTQWSFRDALVQAYTLPYVALIRKRLEPGFKLYLVTSEQQRLALAPGETEKVNLEWKKDNMYLQPYPYRKFGVKKMVGSLLEILSIYQLIRKEKIRTIHAFCMPAGSLGYILSVLTGTQLVIDSYEPHAEAMVENRTWKKNGLAYSILHRLEKLQTKKAVSLIGTTRAMKDYASERFHVNVKSFFVKPACVDLEQFQKFSGNNNLPDQLDLRDKIICVYSGKLGGIYLKEEVFDFIRCCYDHW